MPSSEWFGLPPEKLTTGSVSFPAGALRDDKIHKIMVHSRMNNAISDATVQCCSLAYSHAS